MTNQLRTIITAQADQPVVQRKQLIQNANDNWQDHESASMLREELKPTRTTQAVITRTLNSGACAAIVRSVSDATGIGIVEVFQLE